MLRKSRRITVDTIVGRKSFSVLEKLEVSCESDGSAVIRCDATTAARLAGRDEFGAVATTQEALKDRIADAWYAAGCPRRDPATAGP